MGLSLEEQFMQDFGTITFSDKDPKGKGLGFRAKEDSRDWQLDKLLSGGLKRDLGVTRGRSMWMNPIQLDQGVEGACVGFGWTGWANARPHVHEFQNQHGFDVYHEAQKLDPWEGEDYEGTSVRAGAQAMQARGHLTNYAFTNRVDTLAMWLLNEGPAVIGVDWYEGMDRVDSNGYIYPTSHLRGGHCVIIDGVDWERENVPNRFRIRNSWGIDWGLNGRCYIKATDLTKLFNNGGHAAMAVEVA